MNLRVDNSPVCCHFPKMLVFTAASTSSAAGYGLFLLETAAALGLIALAAWGLVRFANKRLLFGNRGTRLRALERLPLDARNSLYLVEADGAVLLVGVSDRGLTLVKEMNAVLPGETASRAQEKPQ